METLSLLVVPTLGMKRKDRLHYMKPFKILLLLLFLLVAVGTQAQVKHKKGLKQTEREIFKKFDTSKRLLGNFDKDRSEPYRPEELFFCVEQENKFGIVDGNLKEIVPAKYDKLSYHTGFSREMGMPLFEVVSNGKKGIVSDNGTLVLEAIFEEILCKRFDKGDEKWKYILGRSKDESEVFGVYASTYDHSFFTCYAPFMADSIEFLHVREYDFVLFHGINAISVHLISDLEYDSEIITRKDVNTEITYVDNTPDLINIVGNDSTEVVRLPRLLFDDLEGPITFSEPIYKVTNVGGFFIGLNSDSSFIFENSDWLPRESYPKYYQLEGGLSLFYNDEKAVIIDFQKEEVLDPNEVFEADPCGNFFFRISIRKAGKYDLFTSSALDGNLVMNSDHQVISDDLYQFYSIDTVNCYYVYFKDERRSSFLTTSEAKEGRGIMNGKGSIVVPNEFREFWRVGSKYLAMKGGVIEDSFMGPTVYKNGEWYAFDANFKQIGRSKSSVGYEEGGMLRSSEFTYRGRRYSRKEFLQTF